MLFLVLEFFSLWRYSRYSITIGSVHGHPNGASSPATHPRWPPFGVTISRQFGFAWNNREQDSFTRFLVLMQHQTRNQFIEQLQLPAWTVTCNFSNFGTNLWSENRSFYFHSSSLPHNKVVKKTNAPDYWTYHSQHDLVLDSGYVLYVDFSNWHYFVMVNQSLEYDIKANYLIFIQCMCG